MGGGVVIPIGGVVDGEVAGLARRSHGVQVVTIVIVVGAVLLAGDAGHSACTVSPGDSASGGSSSETRDGGDTHCVDSYEAIV